MGLLSLQMNGVVSLEGFNPAFFPAWERKRRLRRTGVVRSIVPPFPTRIASLDSRGSLASLQPPCNDQEGGDSSSLEPSPLRISEMAEVFMPESKLYVCRGRCPHRPVRICCFTVMFGEFVIFIGPMWASAPTSLRKSHTLRIPYVKYSTGANETTCTAYRALGKPDSTAARRAFGLRTA